MWWILRRARLTGASFFSQSSSTNNNNVSKAESRPPRKNYNQLSSNEKLDNRQTEDIHIEEAAAESDASSTDLDERDTRNVCPPCRAHADRYNNNHRHDDFSDDSDYEEALTCNVCDRSFPSRRDLADHQQKKRHFGCSACDSLFPSLMALEHHKEEFQHWSDSSCCSHSESEDSEADPHDRHRLL
ncbi:uncharacterized protein LOC105387477 [Plutella xylostella]|uniref:uncharacterized protein LOC105387477 n=1 Tax=Plutella xylostella TaxID=51655 RepID=UPI0005D04F4B|nr:uncharacterized protein LOC105387477 [Plutella xylostella]